VLDLFLVVDALFYASAESTIRSRHHNANAVMAPNDDNPMAVDRLQPAPSARMQACSLVLYCDRA
jgi:hypothetical protein